MPGICFKNYGKIDKEIILWDNASDDGTKDYILKMSEDYDFIKPVLNETNIGVNAKGKAFEISKGEFIACLDDDILELPEEWAEKMVEAFKSDPELGYLALDVIQNEHTTGAKLSEENYKEKYLITD
ncbi:MAG: glycosyltransferase family 2 protein [Ignavibacteria bacterium]|nr:glycosyltransferase family 2 protein [Ignavibacteria bacterium]